MSRPQVLVAGCGAMGALLAEPADPGERLLLVTLQNGMGNAEALLAVPGLPVARGVSMDDVRHLRPGRFAFDSMEYVHQVRRGALPADTHAGSMALDIASGADTEIEELTGCTVREADRLGLPVPVCRAVFRLTKGLEFAARRRHPIPTTTETTRP